jgi:putative FmdB family regulatory protein
MPIREYMATDPAASCDYCRDGFELVEQIDALSVAVCPECGSNVGRQISAPRIKTSESGLDDRAKSAGFKKLKRLGKGEYEQQY